MAELLDQSGNIKIPPLLLLRPGEVAPPVFITHGIGSSVMDLFNLVHSLDTPHPVCGMQARGMDSLDEPFDRIEDMADYFLDAIKTVQPHGPYILVGYSLGGLVTLEMARRLTERGEKLALLALLETYPHRRHLSLGPRIQLASQLARHHVAMLGKVPVLSIPNYLFGGSAYRMKVSEELFEQAQNGSAGFTPTRATRKVHEKSYSALMRYRPPDYDGRIRFVRAATSLRFPKSPSAAWAGRLPGLEIETVPGTHQSIIAADSATLAAVLSRYLREASA